MDRRSSEGEVGGWEDEWVGERFAWNQCRL